MISEKMNYTKCAKNILIILGAYGWERSDHLEALEESMLDPVSALYAKPAIFHDCPSPYMEQLGRICEDYYNGVRIDADTFYREIFPPDTIEHYHRGEPEPAGHTGNPLILCQRGAWMYPDNKPDWAYGIKVMAPEGEYHTRHTKRILFNDYQWLHDWKNLPDCKHVWMSGLTYLGKTRDLTHAVAMHALIFDIDFVSEQGLKTFFGSLNATAELYPEPNYIVLSGNGAHLYYAFMEPIQLYHGDYGRKVKSQLNKLKMALTRRLWNPYTIDDDDKGSKPQYQGINQAFRMVGSYTKSLDADHNRYKVIAYKFPQVKPYDSLEPFYRFVDIAEEDKYRERSALGLDYWKEKNPEWYERRIVQKDKSVKYWNMNRRLYDWWLQQIKEKVEFGHRYNSLFCAVVYGVKCNIPEEEIEKDLMALLPVLTSLKPDDPITKNDVYEVMDAYSEMLNTYPVKSIEYLSGVHIRENAPRRNGRPQKQHLRVARAIRDTLNDNWREGNGRKPKADIVKQWRSEHPNGKKIDCERDTGLSRHTVLKWWEYQ